MNIFATRASENSSILIFASLPRRIVYFSTKNEEINLFLKIVTYSTLCFFFFSKEKLKINVRSVKIINFFFQRILSKYQRRTNIDKIDLYNNPFQSRVLWTNFSYSYKIFGTLIFFISRLFGFSFEIYKKFYRIVTWSAAFKTFF